ncbi:hypothetical protein F0562_000579 [Nyssa sinensis]|uniref:Uncharacterized protein n=1 Tax=Nyssa sinensis TaxID=561372 RepID=A0A5J5C0I3_9ASTE|nr:hypothetical protein F0562_000579 [Nyssa sinensis]
MVSRGHGALSWESDNLLATVLQPSFSNFTSQILIVKEKGDELTGTEIVPPGRCGDSAGCHPLTMHRRKFLRHEYSPQGL